MQGVPSFKTVHRTVLKFTLCEAPDDMQGFAPHPTRGSAKGTKSLWNPIIIFSIVFYQNESLRFILRLFSSCILVNFVELLEIADLFVSLVKNSLNVRPVKSLICTENHYVIEQVVDLVHELVIVAVFCCDNCLGSFLANLLAYLVYALLEKVAGI